MDVWGHFAIPASVLLLAAMLLAAARATRNSALGILRSRLLLQLAIGNALFSSILLIVAAVTAVRAAHSDNQPSVAAIVLPIVPTALLIAMIIDAGVLFYPRLVRQLRLHAADSSAAARVEAAAENMGVPPPTLMCSALVSSPVVIGWLTRRAILVLPAPAADTPDAVLFHELAHLKNGDAGIVTWTAQFCRTLRWAVLASVLVWLASLMSPDKSASLAAPMSLQMLVLLQLRVLFAIVLRDRERLADQTAALVVSERRLNDAIVEHTSPSGADPAANGTGTRASSVASRIGYWLSDKAMFGRRRWVWRPADALYRYFVDPHASTIERMRAVAAAKGVERAAVRYSLRETLALGWATGTLAAALSLSIWWIGDGASAAPDDIRLLVKIYDVLLIAGILAMGYLAMIFALPAWASAGPVPVRGQLLLRLVWVSVLSALAGLVASLQTLLGGWQSLDVRVMTALVATWVLFVHFCGLLLAITIVTLFLTERYWLRHFRGDLALLLALAGPGIGLVLATALTVIVLRYSTAPMAAFAAAVGLAFSFVFFSRVTSKSGLSRLDQYILCQLGGCGWAIDLSEGGPGRVARIILSFALLLLLPWALCYGALAGLGRAIPYSLGPIPLVLVLLVIYVGCLAWLSGSHGDSALALRARRVYVGAIVLRATGGAPSARWAEPMRVLMPQLDGGVYHRSQRMPWTTMRILHEGAQVSRALNIGRWAPRMAVPWILGCEQPGGFGLWPGCTARLSATMEAIDLLREASVVPARGPEVHGEWVRSLQSDDGSFRDPRGRRGPAWDTFQACRCLSLLEQPLAGENRGKTLAKARVALRDAIADGRFRDVRHWFGVLTLLGGDDPHEREMAANWAQRQLQPLILKRMTGAIEDLYDIVLVLADAGLLDNPPESLHETLAQVSHQVTLTIDLELASLSANGGSMVRCI